MRIKTSTLLFAFFLSFQTQAQWEEDLMGSWKMGHKENPRQLVVGFDAGIFSSGFNPGMMTNVLFGTQFNSRNKQAFVDSKVPRANGKAGFSGEIGYRWGFFDRLSLEYNEAAYLNMSKPMAQLLLFGNAPFAGELVESGNTRFLNYGTVGLGMGQGFSISVLMTSGSP